MRRLVQDAGHLIRPALILLTGLAVFLVVRSAIVPKAFGQYGHYRPGALALVRQHPIAYAGQDTCVLCHDDEAKARAAGKHAHVACEACHGPLAQHADDPAAIRPQLPDVANLCRRCHEKDAAKPTKLSRRWSPPNTPAAWPATSAINPTTRISEARRRAWISAGAIYSRSGGKLLVLASVGATLEQITGAEPARDAYKMADHWWGMLIDIDKCIGCGNCVRACSKENNVPQGYFRTWVERYQIEEGEAAAGGFARWRHRRLPALHARGRQELLRPQAVQPLRGFALRAGLPGGRHVRQSRRRGAGG